MSVVDEIVEDRQRAERAPHSAQARAWARRLRAERPDAYKRMLAKSNGSLSQRVSVALHSEDLKLNRPSNLMNQVELLEPLTPDLESTLYNVWEETVEETACRAMLMRAVREAVSKLSPREQRLIAVRYGIGVSRACTMAETARLFDISIERVRQIEYRILRKLTFERYGGHILASYLDE